MIACKRYGFWRIVAAGAPRPSIPGRRRFKNRTSCLSFGRISCQIVRRERSLGHDLVRRERSLGHDLVRRGHSFSHDLVRRGRSLGHGLVRRGRRLGHDLVRRGRSLGHDLVRRGRAHLCMFLVGGRTPVVAVS